MDPSVSALALAYGADLALGDPRWWPHPIRAMGMVIAAGEQVLRRLLRWERLAGLLLVVIVVGASYGLSWYGLQAARASSWALGVALEIVLLFSCLSTRDLAAECRSVLSALEADDLPLARARVGRIVGRDTPHLDGPEVVRATVETAAESTLDGIVSPLFYVVVGGAPLAIAYKAVNTLDSMIGHRSARYIRFGWAAAKLDTAANWLPARLCVPLCVIAAWACGQRPMAAWRCALRDGRGGPVPNAAYPEAAMAGALGVRLGGTNWYEGAPVEMPCMGDALQPLAPARIREAIRLMYACSLTAFLAAIMMVAVRSRW